jgi:hypothetical protein
MTHAVWTAHCAVSPEASATSFMATRPSSATTAFQTTFSSRRLCTATEHSFRAALSLALPAPRRVGRARAEPRLSRPLQGSASVGMNVPKLLSGDSAEDPHPGFRACPVTGSTQQPRSL